MEVIKELGINILAIIVGGLIVIRIARWRDEAHELSVNRNHEVLLKENVDRIRKELRKNLETVIKLNRVLGKGSKVDILEGERADANTISFFSFHYLMNSQLIAQLPTPLESYIFEAYKELENVRTLYQSIPAADDHYETIRKDIEQIRTRLETSIKKIEEFRF